MSTNHNKQDAAGNEERQLHIDHQVNITIQSGATAIFITLEAGAELNMGAQSGSVEPSQADEQGKPP